MPDKFEPSNPEKPEGELPEIDLSQKAKEMPEWRKKLEQKRLKELGLSEVDREYDLIKDEEKEAILKSPDRIKAFESINTSTEPQGDRIKQKQGIVSEIIKKGLVPEEVLRNNPLLYLGSGLDVEYPLALGSRKIMMADYKFKGEFNESLRELIQKRIKSLTNKDISMEGDSIVFDFNFGEGDERVTVDIIGVELPQITNVAKRLDTKLSQPEDGSEKEKRWEEYNKLVHGKIGIILKFNFCSDKKYDITIDEDIKSKIVDGGVILEEDTLSKKDVEKGTWYGIKLGRAKED